jgi:hypothetical protein
MRSCSGAIGAELQGSILAVAEGPGRDNVDLQLFVNYVTGARIIPFEQSPGDPTCIRGCEGMPQILSG